jgi:hypothetical protein
LRGAASQGAQRTRAALQLAALDLAHATPHARVLTGLERPPQALFGHGAAPADVLRLLDLRQCRSGVPDREEQLGVLVTADGLVAPIHQNISLLSIKHFAFTVL